MQKGKRRNMQEAGQQFSNTEHCSEMSCKFVIASYLLNSQH